MSDFTVTDVITVGFPDEKSTGKCTKSWCLSYRQASKAKISLHLWTLSPEPSLLPYIEDESKGRLLDPSPVGLGEFQ